MKILSVIFVFLIEIGMADGQTFDVKSYQWKKRILLVFVENFYQKLYQEQIKQVNVEKTGYLERDLVVLSVLENELLIDGNKAGTSITSLDQLRTDFQVDKNSFCVILLGKDGGEKLRSVKVIPSHTLFDIIDAMPMRKNEINKHN